MGVSWVSAAITWIVQAGCARRKEFARPIGCAPTAARLPVAPACGLRLRRTAVPAGAATPEGCALMPGGSVPMHPERCAGLMGRRASSPKQEAAGLDLERSCLPSKGLCVRLIRYRSFELKSRLRFWYLGDALAGGKKVRLVSQSVFAAKLDKGRRDKDVPREPCERDASTRVPQLRPRRFRRKGPAYAAQVSGERFELHPGRGRPTWYVEYEKTCGYKGGASRQ